MGGCLHKFPSTDKIRSLIGWPLYRSLDPDRTLFWKRTVLFSPKTGGFPDLSMRRSKFCTRHAQLAFPSCLRRLPNVANTPAGVPRIHHGKVLQTRKEHAKIRCHIYMYISLNARVVEKFCACTQNESLLQASKV